jgi:hypothetical protein
MVSHRRMCVAALVDLFDLNMEGWLHTLECVVADCSFVECVQLEEKRAGMTIVIDPDVIELPEEIEEEIDPDDLEYEDPPALPVQPNWDV